MATLTPGSRVGGYEILSLLGRGGMGEVWRARDLKLRRHVAIKTLPPELATDPERGRRLEREARLLAALNHPNVAAIHGAMEEGGDRFLVLEFVEGLTLAERLATGPLPVAEALSICIQIASGLEAAHAAGIIHRDLKPSNIKLRPDGTVKVLDLGLAQAVETLSAEPEGAPTVTAKLTLSDTLLGTLGYMSPEQARGLPLDPRSDIFSFGAVLYECLAGKHAFLRAIRSDTLAAVLTSDPDWGGLPPELPRPVTDLLRRCLQRDLRQRFHHIADARIELEEAKEEVASGSSVNGATPAVHAWRGKLPWAIGGVLAGIVIGFLGGQPWRPVPPPRLSTVSASLHLAPGLVPGLWGFTKSIALSPDGHNVVFQGSREDTVRLYRRALGGGSAEPIAGTEGGFAPFFSPDGQWLAFFTGTHVLRVPTAGGTPIRICEVPPVTCGGAWSHDDRIIFARTFNGELWFVPESGGDPQPLTHLGEGEHAHLHPQVLPGDWVLFTAVMGQDFQDIASSRIMAFNPRSGERRVILEGSLFAFYVGSDWIVFVRDDKVFAAPFDVRMMRVTAPPVKVPEAMAMNLWYRSPSLDVSHDGTLVYVSGSPTGDPTTDVLSLDRRGHETRLPVPITALFESVRLSPDGRMLALTCYYEGMKCKIFLFDRKRQVLSALTNEPGKHAGQIWSPDGRRIAFTSIDRGAPRVAMKAIDGSGSIEMLTPATDDAQFPNSWSPDGGTIAYTVIYTADRGNWRHRFTSDVWFASVNGSSRPRPWTQTPHSESAACFSPDGRHIAYVSDESGRNEIYIRPITGGGKVQISTGGGIEPLWQRGSREILFRQGNRIFAVELGPGPEPDPGPPRPLFDGYFDSGGGNPANPHRWDVSPDGQEIIALRTTIPAESPRELMVVTGWRNELDRLRRHVK